MRPATIKTLLSAGGVIFRQSGDVVETALIAVGEMRAWCLPKGLVDRGETPEETALREVREETGLMARVLCEIGQTSYWFFVKGDNAKCRKTVRYYLMSYTEGSTEAHDSEVEEAAWFPIREALGRLTYKGDREIMQKAMELIEGDGRHGG